MVYLLKLRIPGLGFAINKLKLGKINNTPCFIKEPTFNRFTKILLTLLTPSSCIGTLQAYQKFIYFVYPTVKDYLIVALKTRYLCSLHSRRKNE